MKEKLYCRLRLGRWNFDSVCSWLSAMSRRGFVLRQVRSCRFFFAKQEPCELEYHIEYLSANLRETLSYTQLCGWNYICSDGYLHYFCCKKGMHYYTGAFYKRTYYNERKRYFASSALSDAVSFLICAACSSLIALRLSGALSVVLFCLIAALAIVCAVSLANNLLNLHGIKKRLAALPRPCIPSATAFLVTPDERYADSFLAACKAYRESGSPLYDISTPAEARAMIRRLCVSASSEEPFFTYWLVDNGEYIGSANLRLNLTPEQRRCGGNIAYEIRPEMRLKGYGTIILTKMLDIAAQKGLSSVLLTCRADNVSAVNTIENCGGKLTGLNVVTVDGIARPTRVYNITLDKNKE